MTPIDQMSIGEAISSIKDGLFIIGIVWFGWRARSWVQPAIDFFKNANQFMIDMRHDMQTLLTNHMTHIESDLRHLSGRPEHDSDNLGQEKPSEGNDVFRQ